MNAFTAPHFIDETEARSFLERLRWPNGPVCHHCGESQRRYATKREGRFRCGNPECRKDYSVTTGTVMERSHIPLTKWLMAFYLMCSSKKGFRRISSIGRSGSAPLCPLGSCAIASARPCAPAAW